MGRVDSNILTKHMTNSLLMYLLAQMKQLNFCYSWPEMQIQAPVSFIFVFD